MKVIVDAQLPFKLCEILNDLGIESIHVENLPLKDETPDQDIIKYSDQHDLVVISKDYDFYHSHMILNKPGRLFQLFTLFRNNIILIKDLLNTCTFIELSNEGLTGHE
jgi:predicted nuclease of predicted toxin-antitoxin system